jgi:urease accessory protein UreH
MGAGPHHPVRRRGVPADADGAHVAERAALVLVDAFTAGRAACGETWEFAAISRVWNAARAEMLALPPVDLRKS